MVPTENVRQLPQSHNSVPRHGILTLIGYGIQVRVDKGHLVVHDGIGADRYNYRLPRVGHGLKRLVVVGSDGQISLDGTCGGYGTKTLRSLFLSAMARCYVSQGQSDHRMQN